MDRAAGIKARPRIFDLEFVVAGRNRHRRELLEAAVVVEDSRSEAIFSPSIERLTAPKTSPPSHTSYSPPGTEISTVAVPLPLGEKV